MQWRCNKFSGQDLANANGPLNIIQTFPEVGEFEAPGGILFGCLGTWHPFPTELPCHIGIFTKKQASGSDFLRKRIEELHHGGKDVCCFFWFSGVGCWLLVVGFWLLLLLLLVVVVVVVVVVVSDLVWLLDLFDDGIYHLINMKGGFCDAFLLMGVYISKFTAPPPNPMV